MILSNPKKYKLLGFEKSIYKNKKYDAILINGDKIKRIPFGELNYQQYKDNALGIYSNLNHYDKARRELYYARHGRRAPLYSSKWFSHHYLW